MRKMIFDGLTMGLFSPDDSLIFYTNAQGAGQTVDPTWTNGGRSLTVDWGDGSTKESHATALSHVYANAGTKKITFTPTIKSDGWKYLTAFDISADNLVDPLPNWSKLTALTTLNIITNAGLTGSIPSLAALTLLTDFRSASTGLTGPVPPVSHPMVTFLVNSSRLSGPLPSLADCPHLISFSVHNNYLLTGAIDFTGCTALVVCTVQGNLFTGYTGGLAGLKNIVTFNASACRFPQSVIDAMLADFVTSLGISGRAVQTTTNLSGIGNDPPSAAGLANMATLQAAGWTVTVNRDPIILVMGDSISTVGSPTWPTTLQANYNGGVCTVFSVAMSGAQIMDGVPGQLSMGGQVAAYDLPLADYIIVFLGTNDTTEAEVLETTYAGYINALKAKHPTATIFGLGILDRHDMTRVAGKRLRISNACTAAGITYVDNSAWINHETDTYDGVHPNAGGIVLIEAAIRALLP